MHPVPSKTKLHHPEQQLEANSRLPLILKKVGILFLISLQVKFRWIDVNSTARNTMESLWKEGLILMYFFLSKFHPHKTFKRVTPEPLSLGQKPQVTDQDTAGK